VPRGAQVEQMVWERSKRGKPRRRRSDRPLLTHDPGWDWDGTRVLFSDTMLVPEVEEDRGVQAQLWEHAHSPALSGRSQATLSLLDVARYDTTRRCRKARSGFDDFEIIRVPKVFPVTQEEPDLWDSWELGEWEKLDALGLKRTYSEVARGMVEGRNPPDTPGCFQFAPSQTEDDSWECL